MDEQEEGREMSESSFDRELQAKQAEVDGLKSDVADLQARLDVAGGKA